MSRNSLSTLVKALSATILLAAAGQASAHKTDMHHWFEHERARIEGGDIFLGSPSTAAEREVPAQRVASRATDTQRTGEADCLIEEMKRSEGYVPASCTGGLDGRWIVDEDKVRDKPTRTSQAR